MTNQTTAVGSAGEDVKHCSVNQSIKFCDTYCIL